MTASSDVLWRLRAWDDPQLEEVWLPDRVVSMSADEIGDLTSWPGNERVAERLSRALPSRSAQAIGILVRYWNDFRLQVSPGDLVLVPIGARRAALGRIVGDYEYDSAQFDVRLRHRRRVDWLRVLSRSELDEDIRRVVNAPGTICRVNAMGAAARLAPESEMG